METFFYLTFYMEYNFVTYSFAIMPLFGPKRWNIYQYFSRNLKILTRCIKYISPPLDTKNTFKTWRSGATHIKPWWPFCCVLSCLTVLALLWHSILGQVNPCTPGSVRHGYPSVSVKFLFYIMLYKKIKDCIVLLGFVLSYFFFRGTNHGFALFFYCSHSLNFNRPQNALIVLKLGQDLKN